MDECFYFLGAGGLLQPRAHTHGTTEAGGICTAALLAATVDKGVICLMMVYLPIICCFRLSQRERLGVEGFAVDKPLKRTEATRNDDARVGKCTYL